MNQSGAEAGYQRQPEGWSPRNRKGNSDQLIFFESTGVSRNLVVSPPVRVVTGSTGSMDSAPKWMWAEAWLPHPIRVGNSGTKTE